MAKVPGNKATSKTSTAAGSAEGAEEEEAKRQAEAAAAAEAEAKSAALSDLRGRLVDTLDTLASADKSSALQAREMWVSVGDLLREGRALFIKPNSNEPNDIAFGRWIEEQGFTGIGARPTRAAAIWLSEVYHTKRDLFDLFPQESKNGEPLRRSPRTLRDWVREQMNSVFQMAWEASHDAVEIAAEVSDKGEKEKTARASVKNVYDVLLEIVDSAEATVEKAGKDAAKAKSKEDRLAAQAAQNAAHDRLDELTTLKDILDVHSDSERMDYFMAWKPRIQAVPFKDTDVDTAAERVFALLRTHTQFGAVYDALGALVEAEQAKVRDAEAAKETEGEGAAGDDFDAGEEEAPADDFDPEADADEVGEDDGFDADEGFEAEVDDNFEGDDAAE